MCGRSHMQTLTFTDLVLTSASSTAPHFDFFTLDIVLLHFSHIMSVLRDHYQTADSVTMDNSQAAITVFSIVELLEDILLNLPLRDLDLAQLISKTVYNCVNNSMKIKQALFLAPATETRLIFNDDPRTLFGRTWMTVDGWRGRFRPLLNPFFRLYVLANLEAFAGSPATDASFAVRNIGGCRLPGPLSRHIICLLLCCSPTRRLLFSVR